jgi:hypothetical protein
MIFYFIIRIYIMYIILNSLIFLHIKYQYFTEIKKIFMFQHYEQ